MSKPGRGTPRASTTPAQAQTDLPGLLVEVGFATSNGEAMRPIKQGAVRLDDRKVAPGDRELEGAAGDSRLLKVGKRRFARLNFR